MGRITSAGSAGNLMSGMGTERFSVGSLGSEGSGIRIGGITSGGIVGNEISGIGTDRLSVGNVGSDGSGIRMGGIVSVGKAKLQPTR